ncbi:hypothetical protein DSECCO2_328390 [anaerobic digester metagenome]
MYWITSSVKAFMKDMLTWEQKESMIFTTLLSMTEKALFRGISSTTFSRRSFSTTTVVLAIFLILDMPIWALLTLSVSKEKGVIAITKVIEFRSLATWATTGAVPVPVPPPIPAMTNTMSRSFMASFMASLAHSAQYSATSGNPSAPRPSVTSFPMSSFLCALTFCRDRSSVFIATVCTFFLQLPKMLLTMLLPAPPQPTTDIFGSARPRLSIETICSVLTVCSIIPASIFWPPYLPATRPTARSLSELVHPIPLCSRPEQVLTSLP